MSSTANQKTLKISPQEIVFLYENSKGSIKRIIFERLKKSRPNLTIRLIDKELTKLKRRYDADIITEAREVIKSAHNKVFTQK